MKGGLATSSTCDIVDQYRESVISERLCTIGMLMFRLSYATKYDCVHVAQLLSVPFASYLFRPIAENGDDVKTLRGNLGYTTAAFSLDVYGMFRNV